MPLAISDDMYTSFGVSNINVNKVIELGETYTFDVAMIYNTGDFIMNVTSTWSPEDGSDVGNIMVNIFPAWVVLYPDKTENKSSQTVRAEVKAVSIGNYSGSIDFDCDVFIPKNYTGNPSAPGGTATASFMVVIGENGESEDGYTISNELIMYCGLFIVAICAGTLLYAKRGLFISKKAEFGNPASVLGKHKKFRRIPKDERKRKHKRV